MNYVDTAHLSLRVERVDDRRPRRALRCFEQVAEQGQRAVQGGRRRRGVVGAADLQAKDRG